ncbi:MAG: beta-ketoacyl-ACP synthase II [Planctomycetota bacterium]
MSRRRVVITGLGCVTALAESADGLFAALCEGKSGVSPIQSFDTSEFPVKFGGEIKNFNPTKYVEHRESKRMDRFTQFAAAAASQAVDDSGFDLSEEDVFRTGAILGTGVGGIKEIEDQHKKLLNKGPTRVSPFCVPKLMGNAAAGNIAIRYGLKGPNICVVSACASGSHAIGEAFCNILAGRSDLMITGGSEAALTPIGLASFCAARSLSTRNDDPTAASRPFDRDRDGFVLSEGAGVLVLEEYEHAGKRGANMYAEILGYSATDDGYHLTAPLPDGEGAAMAMKLALIDAGVEPQEVDYINAHGTGTELNDITESAAIKTVFGDQAYKLLISSTKSSLGHLLGASGAVELIICVKVINNSTVPPTINLENQDVRCDLKMDYVPLEARPAKVNVALSNSFGFGGHNACLVVGKV